MRPLTPLRFAKITRINLIEIWSSLLLSIINNFNRNLIITSSFVTSINNFNLARVAIESWKKKKETTRYNFLPFFLSSTNVLFFFFSPPFFVYFRPALCFPISYKSNGIAQSPRTSAFAIAFFLAPSSSFFTAAYPYESRHHRFIYIYILNKDYPFVAREKFRGKIHDDWSNSMKKNSGRRGCLYIEGWKMG